MAGKDVERSGAPRTLRENGFSVLRLAPEATRARSRGIPASCAPRRHPPAAQRFSDMNALMDVRSVLPVIHVPTLVLQGGEHRGCPRRLVDVRSLPESRYVAERIPGAKLVVLPGVDYLPWVGSQDALLAEVTTFATGTRPARGPNRVLLTVLFTDIVDSTGRLAELGDERWRDLLTRYDLVVRDALERSRGNEVDRAGDGLLATFDGPGRAIGCAEDILREARLLGLEIRAGIHTGEVELDGDRVSGIAVHIGARIAALAGPDEVLVSSTTVKDLVAGSGLRFEERGPANSRRSRRVAALSPAAGLRFSRYSPARPVPARRRSAGRAAHGRPRPRRRRAGARRTCSRRPPGRPRRRRPGRRRGRPRLAVDEGGDLVADSELEAAGGGERRQHGVERVRQPAREELVVARRGPEGAGAPKRELAHGRLQLAAVVGELVDREAAGGGSGRLVRSRSARDRSAGKPGCSCRCPAGSRRDRCSASGPRISSSTTRSAQRSPTRSSACATGQYWS